VAVLAEVALLVEVVVGLRALLLEGVELW